MKLANTHPTVHLLQKFCLFYNERNLESLLDLFSKTHKPFIWGTGVDEHLTTLDEIKNQILRDWSQSEISQIEFTANSFIHSDFPNWASGAFSAMIVIQGNIYKHPHLRGSIYAIQEDNDWKICHMHVSFPESTQPIGNSFPTESLEYAAA
ncbi:MAG: nuclear transport factor 2 family protein [Alphaproteobacteria bacterium]|nr:nuclear transport factor 2 family protein [Alphaproteobacteria bacterium]